MAEQQGQYLYIHSSKTVKILKNVDGVVEEVYINEAKYDPDGSSIDLHEIANIKKREFYKEFLKKQFKNFIVLTGAGSSIGIGKDENKGLSMKGLWDEAESSVGKSEFKSLCDFVGYNEDKPNIETLLSRIEGNIKFSKPSSDSPKINLEDSKKQLLSLIKEKCNLCAPESDSDFPHIQFLSKITQRKATLPRIKIFTLNYDLLFEKASTKVGAVILDGFSFTTPRTFSGRYFDYDIVQREKSRLKDEDNFITRLFHLYKLHGSLNWEKKNDNSPIEINEQAENPLMVYPRESKYENSYEQPFFEMMARFQQNIRKSDSVLICIGYSFNDKHINAAIEEALNQNPGFQLVVVNPDFYSQNENFTILSNKAKSSEKIIMIDEKFSDFAIHFPEIQTYNHEKEELPTKLK